ncbi:glycosyltransferase family 4 protein [Isoptericola sp. NEAU-Y5]|uniref:D-inositol 3-phosphate glycosyltransferase n=1 Tax=Isoptericola luteus TaxID=2879484 RepID=A0ABS7ZCV1_9MICO|nr:glycosyltransferase family 4 protein [Isoptericola sp. NEAU-Y5]MCA5892876.1 glycosyltransferase family 4 protein [Isoptericola sp. NEAU-Y5]
MVRVALVTSSFLPRFGGVEEHVLHVARDLRRRGHHVVVWAVDQGDETPDEVDGIGLRYLPCPMPARDLGALARFAAGAPGALRAWRAAARADRPDVVHVHCYGPNGPWADLAARRAGVPLVLSSHGETFADAHGVFDRSRLLASALRRSLRRAAAVTGPSRYTLDDLVRRFGLTPGGGVVVPNGIDPAEPAAPRPAWLPGRYVLAVGRMVGVKGFDLLVDAYAHADPGGVSLVIAGDGPDREGLRRRADELGLRERVVLPGRLSRPEVVTAMRSAALVVVPSRVESFGIVVLEAWRAGVPVVATTRGGPPEFVADGENGLLVDPADTPALAAAICRVLDDDALARRLGETGGQAVGAYTWRAVGDRYAKLYGAAGVPAR